MLPTSPEDDRVDCDGANAELFSDGFQGHATVIRRSETSDLKNFGRVEFSMIPSVKKTLPAASFAGISIVGRGRGPAEVSFTAVRAIAVDVINVQPRISRNERERDKSMDDKRALLRARAAQTDERVSLIGEILPKDLSRFRISNPPEIRNLIETTPGLYRDRFERFIHFRAF
jgi:hypothetical protein